MIRIATKDDASLWDAFVEQQDLGSFCHLFGWRRVIQESSGHEPHYLVSVNEQNQIDGLLPLFEVKSLLFGHQLCSTPFCMYGGALADSQEVKNNLEQHACQLANKLGVDYLELRYQSQQPELTQQGFEEKSVHSYFETELKDNDDDILLAIKKKQRAVVRHSLKNELTTVVDQDIDTLFHIYSTSVRNLGTPVFSKKLFKLLVDEFSDKVDVLTVKQDNKALSSVMSFYYKDTVMPYYGGGLNAARGAKSNDHMYYQLMCHSAKKGCKQFDFGRSKNDSGAFKYKRTWGIEPKPLYHYYHLVKAQELPNLSPNNPKYALMINTWQKLPLKVSQIIGPFLSKYVA